jgi:hypothetical protein
MARIILLYIVPLALMVYAVVDCAADDNVERFSVPKVLWIVFIILIPYAGPLAWLAASKIAKPKNRPPGGARPRRPGPLAPDDNPQYLRQLAEDQARRERERRRRERGARGDEKPGGDGSEGDLGQANA